MRNTMRGTVGTGNMLSQNNLIRSRQTAPAPIKRSDSSRIEAWRDEVVESCGSGTSTTDEEHTEGKLKKLTKHLRRKTNESLGSGNGNGRKDVVRTSMYDGSKEGERRMEDWEEGAGESIYLGSVNSEDGRLERAGALLNLGRGEEKKGIEQSKEVQQATA